MRKCILPIAMTIIISIFLSGCIDVKHFNVYEISPPKESKVEIMGTWEVETFIPAEDNNSKTSISYVENAYFGENIASFNNETVSHPEYKIKYVDLQEHILDKYKIKNIEYFENIKSVEVIQISCEDKVFYELLKIEENKIAICFNDGFYILNRISNSIPNDIAVEEKKSNNEKKFSMEDVKPSTTLKESGVLLGLKHLNEQGVNVYRTIWISQNDNVFGKMYEINSILVPRLNGFYSVDVRRLEEKEVTKDVIISKQLSANTTTPMKIPSDENNIERNILFVGNNYISTSVTKYDKNHSPMGMYYEVVPVDNTFIDEGIRLSFIDGENGKKQFSESVEAFLKRNNGIDKDKVVVDDSCFAVERKNGNWRLKGGIKTENGLGSFDINGFPPKVMLNYDDLYIPWSYIKTKFPNATDAYTSPNNKMLIIITDKYIELYSIENNELKDEANLKIPLNNNEKVIMSEWATGSYVSRWEETSKQLGKELEQ